MLYRMYVDECGTDDIISCHLPDHQHLAVTGVVISHTDVAANATPELNAIKHQFFPRADPDAAPAVLHRSDFLSAKGDFECLKDGATMALFQDRLFAYLDALPHTVITVVIDKHAMLRKQHWQLKEPYLYCAEVLAEKYVQYLERVNGRGDVYAESRKDKKNKALAKHFAEACTNGTQFVKDPERFKARLTTFDIEFREKKHNNTGLQIADLYAKPSFDRVMLLRDKDTPRKPFSARFGDLLWDRKYDRSWDGTRNGYGMKYLP
ncbi:DUF3800 domain-containing protein [Sphingopyxis sp. JAI128]|uniref:DUF3800 domain-containing protein n=1 Tax=Sphingopyxis sp. JAI128 TaxID=2723066 RepID=UPI001615FCB7|nr:DUF3800 domain-containing protein [Sphingopyxis sp. JAI128]MBB6427512.1 hypothetical protein [Sphingopyxis sp. JAI128]